MKTVIIDDDSDILRLIEIKLTKAGHDVSTAQDGAEGAALVAEIKPALLILETELANKHGHAIIREAKARKSAPLCIILSSESSDEAIAAGFAAGADDYLIKPFSPRVLLERIRITAIRSARHGA